MCRIGSDNAKLSELIQYKTQIFLHKSIKNLLDLEVIYALEKVTFVLFPFMHKPPPERIRPFNFSRPGSGALSGPLDFSDRVFKAVTS